MTIAPARPQGERSARATLDFLWLEITGKCQLSCLHCYAESGPAGSHGAMTRADWMRVIEEAADLGVGMVQFIGGEPTQHPDLIPLARYTLELGVQVEVFTNLVGITDEMWELFKTHGVRLATSYYSDDPAEHGRITAAANSHRLTTANIARAVKLLIPIRVGIIGVEEGQRTDEAWRLLTEMGVTNIGYDQLRQVGRGIRDLQASAEQLCGNCANGVMAISPTGEVWPCVFSRWLPIGNVREDSLGGILENTKMAETRASLLAAFEKRQGQERAVCQPGPCRPSCNPSCGPDWENGYDTSACQPDCSPLSCDPLSGSGCGPTWEGMHKVHACKPACTPSSCSPNCVPHFDGWPASMSQIEATECAPGCWPTCYPQTDICQPRGGVGKADALIDAGSEQAHVSAQ